VLDWILVLSIGLIAIAIIGLVILVIVWAVVPSLRSQRTPQVASPRSTIGNTPQTDIVPPMSETSGANEISLQTIAPRPPMPPVQTQPTPASAPCPSPIPVPAALSVPRRPEPAPEETESVVAKRILTKQEFGFFWKLYPAVKDRYYIYPQILLRELIAAQQHELPYELRAMWKDGIADFVLADVKTLEAVAVIELDDSTHQTADAQARDQRKNRFVDYYAGIPLLRVPSGQWNMATIQQDLEREVAPARRSKSFLELQECELFRAIRETWEQIFIFPKVSLRQAVRRIGFDFSTRTSKIFGDTTGG